MPPSEAVTAESVSERMLSCVFLCHSSYGCCSSYERTVSVQLACSCSMSCVRERANQFVMCSYIVIVTVNAFVLFCGAVQLSVW